MLPFPRIIVLQLHDILHGTRIAFYFTLGPSSRIQYWFHVIRSQAGGQLPGQDRTGVIIQYGGPVIPSPTVNPSANVSGFVRELER